MSFRDDQTPRWGEFKPLQLFFAVLIALAFIGFFVGTRKGAYEPHPERAEHIDDEPRDAHARQARSYGELQNEPFAANEHWEDAIAELAKERPDLFDEVDNGPEQRAAALEDRAENRAYAGAPPTVPHPVKQTGDLACAACHTEGVEVRGRVASAMSHEFMQNCTQCHASQNVPSPFDDSALEDGPPVENTFVGASEPGEGPRAYAEAPPQIPHSTHMRQECASCHGPMGREGLQTSHPWRQSCQQCHAPSAELDQGLPPGVSYFE